MEEKNIKQEKKSFSLETQYRQLQEKINQQEITSNDIIHDILHTGIATIRFHIGEIILIYGLLTATICWSWYQFKLQFYFMIASIILFVMIGLMEWFSFRKLIKINTENSDIQTIANKIKGVRTFSSLMWVMDVCLLCIWMLWFIFEVGDKRMIVELQNSFSILTITLSTFIILIIWNMNRLSKMIDNIVAQTLYLKGSTNEKMLIFHHSEAYWTGILTLIVSLIGLIFKLMYWPFGNIILLLSGVMELIFIWLTCRRLKYILPKEYKIIKSVGCGCMFVIASLMFNLLHWPFGNLLGLIGLFIFVSIMIIVGIKFNRIRTH